MDYIQWLIVALITSFSAILFFIYCKTWPTMKSNYPNSTTLCSRCSSPTCVRCETMDYSLIRAKLKQFMKLTQSQQALTSLYQVVDDAANNSGETGKDLSSSKMQCPTSLYLPYIITQPWYTATPTADWLLMQDIRVLQDNYSQIKIEYEQVRKSQRGWRQNKEDQGSWSLFYFYNQGKKIIENCNACPFTTSLIDCQLSHFMRGNVFGNACFSTITPSTRIRPHFGPCNYRIRCHLCLQTVPGCSLKVGHETHHWLDGQCLLFDDSYKHSVQHDGKDQDRTILLIDLWHYQLSPAERQALNFIM